MNKKEKKRVKKQLLGIVESELATSKERIEAARLLAEHY